MKKTISFVVAVALILSLAVTVFAAQSEPAETQACNHVWGTETESPAWKYASDTQCALKVTRIKVCTKCAEVNQTTVSTTYRPHDETIFSATCDGTTQTHTYRCTVCKGYLPKRYVTCPGAGKSHVTGCFWLPI